MSEVYDSWSIVDDVKRFWYSHLGSIEEEEEEVEGAVASNTSPDARPKLKSKVIARAYC